MKQNKTFAAAVNTHWLAWAGPDARTPGRKDCACTWASPPLLSSSGGGERSLVCRKRKCTGGQSPSVESVSCRTEAILSSHSLTVNSHDEATSRPLLRLSCHLLSSLFVCLFIQTADYRSVSCFPPQMPLEFLLLLSWREICVWSLPACSLVLPLGAASDREHRQTQHEQSRRERVSKQWEGEACCREKTHSLPPTEREITVCACVKVCVYTRLVTQAAAAAWGLCLISCFSFITLFLTRSECSPWEWTRYTADKLGKIQRRRRTLK